MWEDIVEPQKQEIQDAFKGFGTLEALELVSREGPKHQRTSRYRARFTQHTFMIEMAVDQDGKISVLRVNATSETE